MDEIKLTSVNKTINNKILFKDINLKLEKGKIYGLVGENGSGKSTLIKMILNLTKFKGEITINGYNIRKDYKNIMPRISAIVDYVSLYEFLTGYENLRYFSLLYCTNADRINDILKLINLKKDNVLVKNYSLGMKQRLGIAVSLLKDPDILILDEPTNGLDPKGIKELRELLLNFNNKTIIISSHLISEIEKICTDILFIHNKKIIKKKLSDNKKIRFKLGENKIIEKNLSNNEINNYVNKLVKDKVPIYRIEEANDLENILINMMGESDA